MDLQEIVKILPLFIVAAVFGVTYVFYTVTTHQGKDNAPDWLIVVPFAVGFLLGTPWYLLAKLPEVIAQALWVTVLWCVLYSFAYSGASVALWELQKGIRAMLASKAPADNK